MNYAIKLKSGKYLGEDEPTKYFSEAGIFTLEEAERIVNLKEGEKIVSEEDIDSEIGMSIATCLSLTQKPNGRFDTLWGDKTPAGLARTIKRIIEES
jgi:hypothetical protein